MFQALFFFIVSYRLGALKILYFYYKKLKNELRQVLKRILQEIVKKNNTLSRRNQRTSVLYWRLTDFKIILNPLCIMCSPHHSFPSSIIISSRQKKTALSVNTEGKRPNWKLWPLCVSRHVSNTVLASSIFHQKALVNSTVNYMIECLCYLIFTLNVHSPGILRYVRT